MLKSFNFQLVAWTLLGSLIIIGRYVYIPVTLQVFLFTILLVFLGSLYSVKVYDTSNTREVEVMQQKDAWMFPVMGSGVLFGLFLVFRYINKDLINMLFHFYFSFLGSYSIGALIYERLYNLPIFSKLVDKKMLTVPAIKWMTEKPTTFDLLDVFTLSIGTVFGLFYFFYKTWTMNNILGCAFSIFGIENLMLGQFKVGFILLGLLFFYDIFWVFGTPVMVEVAKNLDGPIKLMFPKNIEVLESIKDYNMIGLGDIVIPGVFVALMLRYDVLNYFKNNTNEKNVNLNYKNCKFFWFTLIGYALGIIATLAVMNIFKAAQPALLYLVPGCLLTSILTAVARKQMSDLWSFNEEEAIKQIKGEKTE